MIEIYVTLRRRVVVRRAYSPDPSRVRYSIGVPTTRGMLQDVARTHRRDVAIACAHRLSEK